MSDNTQLVIPSSGTTNQDVVRTIDRSGDSVPIAAKTQVVQLDVGGEANESLVTVANPMPVSGTVTANAGTGTLAIKPDNSVWALAGTSANVNVTNSPSVLTLDQTATGTITAIDAVVAAPGGGGQMVTGASTAGSIVALNCSGVSAWSAAITGGNFTTTFYFEGSLDSTTGTDGNWISLYGRILGTSGDVNQNNATTNNTFFEGSCGGLKFIRLRAVGGAITTGPTITLRAGTVNTISIGTPLPTGTNVIGTVTAAQATAANLNATVTGTVSVGNFPATQPVSGTVTANQGTANTTANSWPTTITDATHGPAAVKAASTAAVAADPALVVAVSPNNSVAVTGTFFQATQPVSGTVTADIKGNGGATLDQANGSAVPTNGVMVGGGSVAGATNFTVLTVKAASTAAAATDTSLVVQPLVGSHVMNTAAAGTQLVGITGSAAAVLDAVTTVATTPANGLAHLVANVTTPPSLATGQSVAQQCDYQGNTYVQPYRRSNVKAATGTFTSASATSLLAAQASGIFADLASISITQGLGATANVYFTVNISDGTATYKFGMFSNDSVSVTPTGSQPISITFWPPIPATSAATAWTVALSSATDTPTVNVTATFVLQKAS